jgi:hypothetical protein
MWFITSCLVGIHTSIDEKKDRGNEWVTQHMGTGNQEWGRRDLPTDAASAPLRIATPMPLRTAAPMLMPCRRREKGEVLATEKRKEAEKRKVTKSS